MSLEASETASTLRIGEVTGSHLFKIMRYSLQKDDTAKGKFLESANFNVGGCDWSIVYYPNGDATAGDDYTSVFLYLRSTKVEHVKAQLSFAILNQDGNPLPQRPTSYTQKFSQKDRGFGYPNYVKKLALDESVLNDDCLVIRCTVTVFKAFPVEAEPAFPLLVPPPLGMQQLSHLLEAGYGVDVTFEVNGETFNAHKFILAARSPVFRAQFFGPLKDKSDTIIKTEDIEAPVFKSLLHFIYSETVPEFEEITGSKRKRNASLMAQHLLVAADRYDLERLKIICEKILYGSIDRSNVVDLLSLADMHNCIHLKTACVKYLASPEILAEAVSTKRLKVAP